MSETSKRAWYKKPGLFATSGWIVAFLMGSGVIPTFLDFRARREERAVARVETSAALRERLTDRLTRFKQLSDAYLGNTTSRSPTQFCRGKPEDEPDGMVCGDRAVITECALLYILFDEVLTLEEQLAALEDRQVRTLVGKLPPCPPTITGIKLIN